ncbi:hypothetical protein B0H11DRAFT_2238052 [Mycena galericulata]|nr:hypothetical protein B0H11DRAFT_2238052 [Mycena galericulata]
MRFRYSRAPYPFVFVAHPAVTVTRGRLVLWLTSAPRRISSYAATPFICAHDGAFVPALVLVVSFRLLRAPWPRRFSGASRCYRNMRAPSRLRVVPRTSFAGPFVGTMAHTTYVPCCVHKQLACPRFVLGARPAVTIACRRIVARLRFVLTTPAVTPGFTADPFVQDSLNKLRTW